MSGWSEEDSALYRAIAPIAVPRRDEMIRALVEAVPFARDEAFKVVDIGSGDGILADALLGAFPSATVVGLDGSPSMRAAFKARTAQYLGRTMVRDFTLESLDWWDVMFGADVVVSSLCLHHLNDAKKQYLYKAAADRLSERGLFLVADIIEPAHDALRRIAADAWDRSAQEQADAANRPELLERFVADRWNHFRFPDDSADRPSALFHQLMWLKHAGFAAVDCFWLFAGHAVFGGFKRAAASAPRLQAGN
jgi:tRNA (cmo5U34)-methyltransferase